MAETVEGRADERMPIELYAHDDTVAAMELRLAEATGTDRVALLVSLSWHLRQRDTRRALALANEAENTAATANSRLDGARLSLVRAEAAFLFAQFEAARRYLVEARAAFEARGDHVGIGDGHGIEAAMARDLGDYAGAIAGYEAAAACYRRAGAEDRASIVRSISLTFLASSADIDKAPPASNALERAFRDRAIGSLYVGEGDYARAEHHCLAAFEPLRSHGCLYFSFYTLMNAGAAASNLYATERVSNYYNRVFELSMPLGWPIITGNCLRVLGEQAALLDQSERSVELLQEAFELLMVTPRARAMGQVVSQLAGALLELKRSQDVLALCARIRDASEGWQDEMRAELKANEALALAQLDRPQEALALATEARQLADRVGAFPTRITAMTVLAYVHLHHALPAPDGMTAPTPALHYFQEIVAANAAADEPLQLDVLNGLSAALEATGDFENALRYERQARLLAESQEAKRAADHQLVAQSEYKAEKTRLELEHHRQRTAILEASAETLERLGLIGQEITARLDAGAIFETLHRHVAGLMDVHSVLIFMLDRSGEALRCEHGGEDAPAIPLDAPLSDVATAARERREVLVEVDAPKAGAMASILCAPLLQGDALLGVMTVRTEKPHAYGERERSIFQTLCAYGAIALGNAAAYHALNLANARADEATRAKSAFLANMSHEIRTPMNAVIGLSHLALKSDPSPRQANYLAKIQQSGQHLMGIINDILDFSKIEAGKLSIETIEFELDKVLDNVSNLTAEKATAKGLELIFDIDPALAPRMLGDPLRLGQILINFCNNAVKFTEAGEIVVTARIQAEGEMDQLVHFAVTDTGIGLSEAQIGRLFQAFQQADASTTRKYGGTGLGLTISKSLAESMDGSIGVTSKPGMGSTFWFTARLGKSAGIHQRRCLDPDLRGRRILVIDDGRHARAILADMLLSMGFEVHEAPSGSEGIDMARGAAEAGTPYDIAFIDWLMPEIDGIETGRQIRALAGASGLPHRVLVTAHGREEVLNRAEDAGFANVLIKPLKPSMLFDAVVRLFGGDPGIADGGDPAATGMAIDVDVLRGARILIVEDNETNQEVAVGLLEPAEVFCDIAESGEIAVRKVQETEYDIVLMDMQMPVMDGLEATAAIRRDPRFAALPIIAMTANAMASDRERCLAAGMNDHVAKPIDPDALFATLMRWITPRAGRDVPAVRKKAAPAPAPAPAPAVAAEALVVPGIDVAVGLQRTGGNAVRYTALLRKFVEREAGTANAVRAALAAGDGATAERLLHTLKGMAGTLGAAELAAAARDAEKAASSGTRDGAPLDALSRRLDEIVAALRDALPAEAPAVTAEPAADPALATEPLTRLKALLDDDDGQAADFLLDAMPLLSRILSPEEADTLRRTTDEFDFAAALVALEAIAGRLSLRLG